MNEARRLDALVDRVDAQISANKNVIAVVQRDSCQRDYRALTFEKSTGEPLL